MKEKYRIKDVQRAILNGRHVKLFKAFEYEPDLDAYIYCGHFEAPQNTPHDKLADHIDA